MKFGNRINAIQIDLKGVLFKPSYFSQLMSDLKDQGVNAVLVEYEDVFPFSGLDIAWDRQTAWTSNVLRRFLKEAAKNQIEIIPLQQCLGHLEYLFRWQRYRYLAENKKYPGTLCLSHPTGKALILNMLEQVIEAHPESRYIHLGMDEAHDLATCRKCKEKGDTLDVFLGWLETLIKVTEHHGKTPIIWSDMLEDNFRAKAFDSIKDRVILCPWDYRTTGKYMTTPRIEGFRVSKKWLTTPDDPSAPPIGSGQKFIEDVSASTQKLIKPYRRGLVMKSLFQADLWTRLGFRLLGAGLLRDSPDFDLLPRYNLIARNVRCWADAIERTNQLGVIGTSWARGNTFCPPNFNIDLSWPSIADQSRVLGMKAKSFWPGIPVTTIKRIISTLGRCHEDWALEGDIATEMEMLAPRVKAHRYEWDSLALMARCAELRRRARAVIDEVDYFHPSFRPVPAEWQRRLDDQMAVLRGVVNLRTRVQKHFGRRYHGLHFEEWIRNLFDLDESRLKDVAKISNEKKKQSELIYSSR